MARVIASRYASALAEVVGFAGDYRQVLRELEDFAAAYQESPELREVFESPALSLVDKLQVLNAILKRLGTSFTTSNFFRVLVSHYRMNQLAEICQAFQKISNERMGIVHVKISSAGDLSESQRQALRSRFADLTRSQVEMEFERNESLLGGVRAQVRSTVYDGTIRGELDRIRQQLTAH